MAEIRNFEGQCNSCGRHGRVFALDNDEDGYCENCLEDAEE